MLELATSDQEAPLFGLLAQLFTVGDEYLIGTLDFPRRIQWDGYSCGARCVRMVTTHFGVKVSYDDIVDGIGMTEDGSSATPITKYLRSCGLSAGYHREMSIEQMQRALIRGSVVIVDMDNAHWCVVHAMSQTWVWVANPSLRQLVRQTHHETFANHWTGLGIIVGDRRRSSP